MTKALIVGGCGFIGSNFIEFLLNNTKWEINILDNLSTGRLVDVQILNDYNKRVKFFKGDITNFSDISKPIKNCDYIINLAAQTSVFNSIDDPIFDENINIHGLLNVLKNAVDKNIKKVF